MTSTPLVCPADSVRFDQRRIRELAESNPASYLRQWARELGLSGYTGKSNTELASMIVGAGA